MLEYHTDSHVNPGTWWSHSTWRSPPSSPPKTSHYALPLYPNTSHDVIKAHEHGHWLNWPLKSCRIHIISDCQTALDSLESFVLINIGFFFHFAIFFKEVSHHIHFYSSTSRHLGSGLPNLKDWPAILEQCLATTRHVVACPKIARWSCSHHSEWGDGPEAFPWSSELSPHSMFCQ